MTIQSQKQKAYNEIKRAIVTLRFEMGKNINEKALCQELGIGRTPVREALQLLASEGLVEIFPRKGVYVSYVSLEDFQKFYETRLMVEIHCITEATQKISDDEILRLKQLLMDNVEEMAEKRDIEGLLKIDREIHMGIVKSLDNKYIEQIANQVYDLIARMLFLSFKTRTKIDLRSSLEQHLRLLDALATRDTDQSIEEMHNHMDEFVKQIFKYLIPDFKRDGSLQRSEDLLTAS
jgi:DNA-binding GntR family transcriptional regulator